MNLSTTTEQIAALRAGETITTIAMTGRDNLDITMALGPTRCDGIAVETIAQRRVGNGVEITIRAACPGCARKAPSADSHPLTCSKRQALEAAIRAEGDARQEYYKNPTEETRKRLGPLGMATEGARWALSL